MRIFGSQRMDSMLERLGLKEGEAIIHSWINKALEKAQQKVEAHNFEIRKNLLKFDNVMNDQRKVVYEQRREIMDAGDVSQTVGEMRAEVIGDLVRKHIPANSYSEQWDLKLLQEEVRRIFNLQLPIEAWGKEEGIAEEVIEERIREAADRKMAEKVANYGHDLMRGAEKSLLLQLLDQAWKDHLLNLDHLRQGINLRAYGQRDPLNEYKREAFEMFEQMLVQLRQSVTSVLLHVEIQLAPAEDLESVFGRRPQEMRETRQDPALAPTPAQAGSVPTPTPAPDSESEAPRRRIPVTHAPAPGGIDPANPETWGKVQRNASCPCGSGKKYKHCHGQV
jgi:preprotein translocase subunit SecA